MLVIGSFVGVTEGKEYIDLELDLSLKQNPFGSEVLGRILLSGHFISLRLPFALGSCQSLLLGMMDLKIPR